MALESVTYISDLVVTNPVVGDDVAQGDDHIRALKTALKNTFTGGASGLSGAVTASHTELNVLDGIPATLTATELGYVDGVTSAIQTQLDAKAAAVGNWVHIKTTTISGTPSAVEFKHGTGGVVIDSTYDLYAFELLAVLPSTNASNLQVRTSTDGGATYASSAGDYWSSITHYEASGNSVTGTSTASILLSAPVSGTGTGQQGVYGQLFIAQPSAAAFMYAWGQTVYHCTSYATSAHGPIYGTRRAAADIDAIQFLFTSGTMASGTIRMFGRKI